MFLAVFEHNFISKSTLGLLYFVLIVNIQPSKQQFVIIYDYGGNNHS